MERADVGERPGGLERAGHDPPAEIIPESNEPSSAVTVWGASPAFRHVTVEPAGTLIFEGVNEKSWISASAPVAVAPGVAAGVGVGDGLGVGVRGLGFGVAEPFTTTLPVISGWIAHRYEKAPGASTPASTTGPRRSCRC